MLSGWRQLRAIRYAQPAKVEKSINMNMLKKQFKQLLRLNKIQF
jgi:hypothetical protein